MAGSGFDLTGSRIANATRTWQAVEDADVTNWDKSDFVFAAMVEAIGHGGATGTLQLRWRNVTDSGAFAVLGNTGELTYNGTTDLVNGNAVSSGESGCTPIDGATWVDGVEREGANDVSTTLAQNEYTEHHWAIDSSGAGDGKQYEFEVYDSTAGAAVGTCLADITTAAGAATVTKTHTTDAVLEKTQTDTHTTDALLSLTVTKTHTTDAQLEKTQTLAHTTDSVLKGTLTRVHTTDAYLAGAGGSTLEHTTDSLLKSTETKVHTSDSLLKATVSAVHQTDALLKKTLSLTHTTDSLLNKSQTAVHTTDSYLYLRSVKTHTTDAVLKGTQTKSHTTDAYLSDGSTPVETAYMEGGLGDNTVLMGEGYV